MFVDKKFLNQFQEFFLVPGIVFFSLITATSIHFLFPHELLEKGILLIAIVIGSAQLVRDTYQSISNKSFALDYIAILAIITGLLTGNFFVATVIVLMMAGGNTLEIYAQQRARRALTSLSNRIPHEVMLITDNHTHQTVSIKSVDIGSIILVRKGEVIPIDGKLMSPKAVIDASSLTGEPYPVIKAAGDTLTSGVVNLGEVITLKTTVKDENSTYRHIINLVEEAQKEKTPFLQLADALSAVFTVVTLMLAGLAYLFSKDMSRVLAVLVIATPCPLILATPIALIGGMNAAASKRIIFKRLASLEILSQVKAVIFDKTGTLTMGVPELTNIQLKIKSLSTTEVLALAAGLERNSLHPFAKAIVEHAKKLKVTPHHFLAVHEEIGSGLHGLYNNVTYQLKRNNVYPDKISLLKQKQTIANLTFSDVVKPRSSQVLSRLQHQGLQLFLFTGDSQARADELLKNLPPNITVKAECDPERKRTEIEAIKAQGVRTAMVGDGINDAPALALADVGIAFSHEEHTAASEAADVILLESNFYGVETAIEISRHTLFIAKQSMYVGLGLSFMGMLLAVKGYLPPVAGAISQEVIDVAVILNALRAAFPGNKRRE